MDPDKCFKQGLTRGILVKPRESSQQIQNCKSHICTIRINKAIKIMKNL